MPDMTFPTTAKEVARFLGAQITGDIDRKIEILASISSPQENALLFISDKKFSPLVSKLNGTTLLTTPDLVAEASPNTFLVVENPKLAFAKIASHLMPEVPWKGISPLASIHPEADIAEGVAIGPFAVVSERVKVGPGSVLFPHVYVGPNVSIGANCEIHPQVSLVVNVEIGNRVKIFSGSVLGSEGFGFLSDGGSHVAMPQIGRVVIEDDVRIGANCTIDRSTLGETRIGRGSKLDNLVHIAHNCLVGKNCIICGQAVLGGSTTLEDDVMIGGQSGLTGHLTVGKGAGLIGRSGSSFDLKAGEKYFGTPALPAKEAFRVFRASAKLPNILTRLKKIEERLEGTT